MADCLSNAEVLRKVLQHFANPELLKLSFVSKLWNFEARSLMRNRGNLVAVLKCLDDQPCPENLDAFAADLQGMRVVPFSGLRINLSHDRSACQATALDSTYETIIGRLPLKNVYVALSAEWSKNMGCPGSRLARKVLHRFSGVLEEVSLAKIASEQGFMVGFILDFSFPSLKILRLGENYARHQQPTLLTSMKALVARSPKLQELHTKGPINLMLEVLEGSSAELVYQSEVSAPFDEIPECAMNRIRLEQMSLCYDGPNFNVERFNRIAPMLLQTTCAAKLCWMELDAILAVPLMCFGIRLENVSTLIMKIQPEHMEHAEPRILRIVKNFDFKRIFPNLDRVTILLSFGLPELAPDHMNGFVEQANASLKEPEPDRAINIKELDLCTGLSNVRAEFYAEMLPDIKRLKAQENLEEDVSFGSIWKHWVNLEHLDVLVDVEKHYEDLDSVICGIFPEEVAELRQKDEEFLKKVHIVPVMPAITCLRNLRKFILILAPVSNLMLAFPGHGYVEPTTPLVILSKVTGLVAFARCPNLAVTVSTYVPHVHRALRHIEPYASVHNMSFSAAE